MRVFKNSGDGMRRRMSDLIDTVGIEDELVTSWDGLSWESWSAIARVNG
jgi:hypothetical protein